MVQKVIWHPNIAPSFLLLHDITNEKTLNVKQVDRLPAFPRFSPQKHVPTTLVGIPVDIYTLGATMYTVSKQKLYLNLPYEGHLTYKIRRELLSLLSRYFPQIQPIFISVIILL